MQKLFSLLNGCIAEVLAWPSFLQLTIISALAHYQYD